MISSLGELLLWCHWIPIDDPAEIGHFLLAGELAGSQPHVISLEVTKGMGLSKAVEG